MLQFFQTRMGDKFFNATLPRLVTALETLAKNYNSNQELEKRVVLLETILDLRLKARPGVIECADGYSVTVVHYSSLSEGGSYKLAFPSSKEEALEPYRLNSKNEQAVAYELVPEKVFAQVIASHGGFSA